jgi:Ca2+-binding EF-hand superfamily protein
MGVNISSINNTEEKSHCKYPGLGPNNILKIRKLFETSPSTQIDRKKLMDLLQIAKFETDVLFDFFDIDGNGYIDSYEFICSIAMLTHSYIEVNL